MSATVSPWEFDVAGQDGCLCSFGHAMAKF